MKKKTEITASSLNPFSLRRREEEFLSSHRNSFKQRLSQSIKQNSYKPHMTLFKTTKHSSISLDERARLRWQTGTEFGVVSSLLHNTRPIITLMLLFLLISSHLLAQTNLEVQDEVVGSVEISDPGQITMKPGFKATEGCNFRAYIGASQPTAGSATIATTYNTYSAAASSGQNYIKTTTFREVWNNMPGQSETYVHTEDIQYFDGLGRPVQNVSVAATPTSKDIIQPILYDGFGREIYKPLPYTDNTASGAFRSSVTQTTVSDYYNTSGTTPAGVETDGRAFSEIGYDNSPLNRVVSQTGPGSAWSAKPVTISYLSNSGTENSWSADEAGAFSPITYAEHNLYITTTTDEEGNTTREYKDKLGRVVFKESKLENAWLRTTYIYDDFGLLRCVVPPEASDPTTDTELCYYYKYDKRNRMIEKKIPGAAVVTMFYDQLDRLRFTQSGLLRETKQWNFIKYDNLNRPVMTGMFYYTKNDIESVLNEGTLNETRNNTSDYYGYTKTSSPIGYQTWVHTVTWYDDYNFISGLGLSDSLRSITYDADAYDFHTKIDSDPKGRITGTATRMLFSYEGKGYIYSTNWYDKYGNTLRKISENHLKGKDVVSNIYEDITYQVKNSKQEHFKGSEHIILARAYEYDHTGRLLATRLKVNDQNEITESAMKYNEVGQLVTKYLHSSDVSVTTPRSFLQKVDYAYNLRGWLTNINDPALSSGDNDLFGMQLCYNNTTAMGSLAPGGLYNGNIAGLKWTVKSDITRGYGFTYDGLNRMLQSNYADGNSLGSHTGYYNETISLYDKNGNIRELQRKHNNTSVDDLTYAYTTKTNRLLRVTDQGTASTAVDDYPGTSQDYTYDSNGNMTFDGARNITLYYDPTLNLPRTLVFGNNNQMNYYYMADGTKFIKVITPSNHLIRRTHYIGNIIYEDSRLSYILTGEGRLVAKGEGSSRTFVPEYDLKDHLGNTRVTFRASSIGGALEIMQTSNYYPFGLTMNQYNAAPATNYTKNKYLYNGKELQDDNLNGTFFGLYDYGARMYDPQIGRFTCLDPIADQFPHVTPYNYAENKVINCIDLWGLQAVQVSAGARGALPLFGPWGVSASFEFGLILDKNYDLVLYNTVSLGGSFGGALSVGINGTFYPTANSYKDLVGLGVDLGVSTPFLLSGQGNVSFSDNGPKGGGTLSYGFPTLSAGAAAYADVTFTNLMSDPINIKNVTASTISQISQMMKISPQYAKIILLLMRAQIEKEEEKKWAETSIMLPEVVVVGKKTKTLEQRIEDMKWQSVRPNAYGNTGRYNKPGRSCDQYYSDDFLKWYYGDTNKNEEKK